MILVLQSFTEKLYVVKLLTLSDCTFVILHLILFNIFSLFFLTCSLLAKTHFGETHDKHLVIIPSNPTTYMTTDVP